MAINPNVSQTQIGVISRVRIAFPPQRTSSKLNCTAAARTHLRSAAPHQRLSRLISRSPCAFATKPPEGGLHQSWGRGFERQSAIWFWLFFRRYAMQPIPTKPRIITAQVEGSGTAVTVIVAGSPPMSQTKRTGRRNYYS
jgi:hypothetical protein